MYKDKNMSICDGVLEDFAASPKKVLPGAVKANSQISNNLSTLQSKRLSYSAIGYTSTSTQSI